MTANPHLLRLVGIVFAVLMIVGLAANGRVMISHEGVVFGAIVLALCLPAILVFHAATQSLSQPTETETLGTEPQSAPFAEFERTVTAELEDLRNTIAELRKENASAMSAIKALGLNNQQLETVVRTLEQSFEDRLSEQSTSSGDGVTILETIKEAIDDGRVDLHLQPIVSLPQKRVAFYEGFTRLRRVDGSLIYPAEFLNVSESANLTGVIDNMLVVRAVQIIERLLVQTPRLGVFCNISLETVKDDRFFPAFIDYLKSKSDLSEALIFEFRANALADKTFRDRIQSLTSLGFRLSIDDAENIPSHLSELREIGIRFLKTEFHRVHDLLAKMEAEADTKFGKDKSAEIHSRFGLTLIAQKLEEERDVSKVVGMSIPFGQGTIFGGPRPIKKSLMSETNPVS